MNEPAHNLYNIENNKTIEKPIVVGEIATDIQKMGYTIVELNDQKPWGAYIRIDNNEADRFVEAFFPGLPPDEARLGMEAAELSPKILIVAPGQRLSWQYHDRRAERWTFLTPGLYYKSLTDEEGEAIKAKTGDVVQFARGERHRLVGADDHYTIVAEIWQHTDSRNLSNEDDITRLADDYKR